MNKLWNRLASLPALLGLLAFAGVGVVHADEEGVLRWAKEKVGNENPDIRAEAVERLAKENTKRTAQVALAAIRLETDGPAGMRMAIAFENFKDAEALETIQDEVLKWNKGQDLFGAYWTLAGLARGKTAKGDEIIAAAVRDSGRKDYLLKAAALEAIGVSGRTDLSPMVVEILSQYEKKWDDEAAILALSAISAAPKLVELNSEREMRDSVLAALVHVLKETENERIQYFTVNALSRITGEDTYVDPAFWEWWIKIGGYKAAKDRPEGATSAGRNVPKFFKAAAVGKRVVFVIDVSGSMAGEVRMPPQEAPPEKEDKPKGPVTGRGGEDKDKKEEEEGPPPPDYSGVKTKLDLAKVELIHTLSHLPDDYLFNIVIYDTEHRLLDDGTKKLIAANAGNKKKMIKKVEALEPLQLTNIHGALTDAFKITEKGLAKDDPAWDASALLCGAETIFFLTDGSPTISDDTTNKEEVGTGTTMVGNGRMCVPENIVADVIRLNTFRKIVIHTVGIGRHNGGLMRAIADATGGEYIDRSGMAD